MTTQNDITGDNIQSKPTTDKYREGFEKLHEGKVFKELEVYPISTPMVGR